MSAPNPPPPPAAIRTRHACMRKKHRNTHLSVFFPLLSTRIHTTEINPICTAVLYERTYLHGLVILNGITRTRLFCCRRVPTHGATRHEATGHGATGHGATGHRAARHVAQLSLHSVVASGGRNFAFKRHGYGKAANFRALCCGGGSGPLALRSGFDPVRENGGDPPPTDHPKVGSIS